MRILHLLSSPVWSGPAEPVALLATAQRSAGHTVTVAIDSTRAGTGTEESAAPRFDELGLDDRGGLRLCTHDGPWRTWQDSRRLAQRALDVVHAHFSHDHWVARLGQPASAVVVRSIHAPRSLRRVVPRADAWTVPTAALGERLRRPWRVLPALVGPAFVPAANRLRLQDALGLSAPVVGMVSTFQPSRRHGLALAAFSEVRQRVPSATLVLVGDGELGPALRAEAGRRGLGEAVRFPGYQGGTDLLRWMQVFDELWVLGLGNDWAGRAAAQGRAVGARVVAVAEGALPDWADATLASEEPAALAAVALRLERDERLLPTPSDVARDIVSLYREAGARG